MAERTQWNTSKYVAAVIAGVSVLLLMTPLHTTLGSLMNESDRVADQWFSGVLSAIIVLCSVYLYREMASLKIAVVLLALGLVLVFAGTLAQTRLGIWHVINEWFRGRVVYIPPDLFRNFFDKSKHNTPLEETGFPFPGGFLILGLLTINMCCAMTVKIHSDLKSSARAVLLRRHLGIYILHVGMLTMFAGEFVTGFYAEEGRMAIAVDGWSDHVEDSIYTELAFVDRTDPENDRHIVIPQSMLERHAVIGGNGKVISDPALPFDLRIEDYMPNSEHEEQTRPGNFRAAARQSKAVQIPAVPGTDMDRVDIPSVYVTLIDKESQEPMGTWLSTCVADIGKIRPEARLPGFAKPQATGPGMPAIELRFARRYYPYRVYLDQVKHEKYPGTEIPFNFSSDVRIFQAKTGANEAQVGTATGVQEKLDRDSHIWMNHPMRYADKAFYQHQIDAGQGLTQLLVVYNPGGILPYVSCGLVTLGMLVQFSVSLFGYSRRSLR